MGARIIQDEILSMKHPTKSRNRLISIKITIELSEMDKSILATLAGTCSIVRKLANDIDRPIIKVVAPFIRTESLKDS